MILANPIPQFILLTLDHSLLLLAFGEGASNRILLLGEAELGDEIDVVCD